MYTVSIITFLCSLHFSIQKSWVVVFFHVWNEFSISCRKSLLSQECSLSNFEYLKIKRTTFYTTKKDLELNFLFSFTFREKKLHSIWNFFFLKTLFSLISIVEKYCKYIVFSQYFSVENNYFSPSKRWTRKCHSQKRLKLE